MAKQTDREAKTFGDWAYIAIAKHFQKILKHEQAVLKDKDPEELHQMRVGMRRLRSAIAGFSPALNLPTEAKAKNVGKVARILGQLRDLDVLKDILKNQYRPTLPKKEQKQLDNALDVLTQNRKTAFEQVKQILESRQYINLKKAFQNWLDRPTYTEIASISINSILPDLLLPQASNLLLHPGWLTGIKFEEGEAKFSEKLEKKQVEEILNTQGVHLHELRKEAKRSRYNMELFTQFYGESYQDYLNEIKTLQAVLGDMQDGFVLAEFLTEAFEEDFKKKMPVFAGNLVNTRFQKWQDWEKLQHNFLNSKTRKDLHLTLLNPMSSD